MIYAHARNNKVVNRIEWEGAPFEVDGILIRDDSMPEGWDIGWVHDETGWHPPPEPEEDPLP